MTSTPPVATSNGHNPTYPNSRPSTRAKSAAASQPAPVSALLDDLSNRIVLVDQDLRIGFVNKAALADFRSTGTAVGDADELVGRRLDEFVGLVHDDADFLVGLFADPSQLPYSGRSSIGVRSVDLTIVATFDSTGGYSGAVVSWDDVTVRLALESAQQESLADAAAVNRVLEAVGAATTIAGAVRVALDIVRDSFGWAYGSYWEIEADNALHFRDESGDAGPEFHRVTLEASFREGVGLSGRAWKTRDLFFTPDIGEMTDCVRAPIAQKVGVKSGVCFPITMDGQVVGTMDFFATETLKPSEQRLDALRNVGRLVSAAMERKDLSDKVDKVLAAVSLVAAGDLTAEIPVRGTDAIGRMGEGLESLLHNLRTSMGEIGGTAEALAAAAEQLTALSDTMGEGASQTSDRAGSASAASEEVSASIQTVATAAEEMTASISEIAKNASDAAKVATTAVTVAGSAQTTVSSLGESSAEIGKVIKLITSIAQQTNLLALNATIEAARAGEAGKGFAVVANEVKELAKETARATEDIGQKIEAIQSNTRGAVDAISEIGEIIDRINDIQTTIASAVEEQTATTNEIARSVTEAATGANGIAADIATVASAARTTQQGSVETQESATGLAGMATELKRLLAQFRY